MQRRVGGKPRIASALDGRRRRNDAPDLEHAVGVRDRQVVDLAFEAAQRRALALPEHRAHVGARQRIADAVEAPAVDGEPAFVRLAIVDRHRPADGRQARALDRHLVDVPRLGGESRDDQVRMIHRAILRHGIIAP